MRPSIILAAAVLTLLSFACRNERSQIDGDWTITIQMEGSQSTILASFHDGRVYNEHKTEIGDYMVDGENVSFIMSIYFDSTYGTLYYTFAGTLENDALMSGTVTRVFSNFPSSQVTGTWTATH